ncbi:MAG TPA: rhodanese-like domain-containing protein, partial [Gemmataceae bacterium]|nr:rhodanese-like domain-containing protein [Gemmataceae bacterium]
MTRLALALAAVAGFTALGLPAPPTEEIRNPAIDMNAYLKVAQEAARHRATRRLSEADFLKASREPGVIVLDARSKEKYKLMHVQGAISLSFPDITVESLQQTLPDKSARILIY